MTTANSQIVDFGLQNAKSNGNRDEATEFSNSDSCKNGQQLVVGPTKKSHSKYTKYTERNTKKHLQHPFRSVHWSKKKKKRECGPEHIAPLQWTLTWTFSGAAMVGTFTSTFPFTWPSLSLGLSPHIKLIIKH